jgi:hypothetical protein
MFYSLRTIVMWQSKLRWTLTCSLAIAMLGGCATSQPGASHPGTSQHTAPAISETPTPQEAVIAAEPPPEALGLIFNEPVSHLVSVVGVNGTVFFEGMGDPRKNIVVPPGKYKVTVKSTARNWVIPAVYTFVSAEAGHTYYVGSGRLMAGATPSLKVRDVATAESTPAK